MGGTPTRQPARRRRYGFCLLRNRARALLALDGRGRPSPHLLPSRFHISVVGTHVWAGRPHDSRRDAGATDSACCATERELCSRWTGEDARPHIFCLADSTFPWSGGTCGRDAHTTAGETP